MVLQKYAKCPNDKKLLDQNQLNGLNDQSAPYGYLVFVIEE